jgi:hypothetical protein
MRKYLALLQEQPLSNLLLLGIPLILLGGVLIFTGYRTTRQAQPTPTTSSTTASQNHGDRQPVLAAASTVTPRPEPFIRLAWFYKPPENDQLALVAQKFNFFILTYKDETKRDQLKADGVYTPFAQYLLLMVIQDPGDCQKTPNGNQVAYKAGDFCEISNLHPDWFLLDKKGNRIRSGKEYYFMDPGSAGFQEFWLQRAREMQETNGWNDVFLDNVEASRRKMADDGVAPVKYPDDKSFQTAVEGFLGVIRQNYFQPQGRKMYGNIVAVDDDQVWGRYLQSLDGAMIESFATDWSNGYQKHDDWEQQMEETESALALGKTMILVAQGSQDDEKLQNFAYASYLLVNNGNAVFRYTNSDSYREAWLYDNYNLDLGTPTGKRYQDKGGWRRDFSRGYVTVDPQKHTAEIVVNSP